MGCESSEGHKLASKKQLQSNAKLPKFVTAITRSRASAHEENHGRIQFVIASALRYGNAVFLAKGKRVEGNHHPDKLPA